MNNPFLEQFQAWIEQSIAAQDDSISQRLSEMQSWMTHVQQHASELSPFHADKIVELATNSSELVGLLAQLTRAQARGDDATQWAQQLREQLHQLNLRNLMTHATQSHQLLDLFFTQPKSTNLTGDTEILRHLLLQLDQAPLKAKLEPLKSFIESLIEWRSALRSAQEQLNQISDTAIKEFSNSATAELGQEGLVSLWVSSYDNAYRQAFNSQPMQAAQGALVNSLTEVQLGWQNLIDTWVEQLGLPSRSQMTQLIEALDQQRRRIRSLEIELQALKTERQG